MKVRAKDLDICMVMLIRWQRDTLQSMAICFPVYGPVVARSFARKLWSSIKLEVCCFHNSIITNNDSKLTADLSTNGSDN